MLMIFAIFATFAVLAFQVVFWLRYGYWTSVSGEDFFSFFGFRNPELEWAGVEKLLEFFFQIHIGFTFFTVAFLLGFVVDAIESDTTRPDERGDENPINQDTIGRTSESEKIEPKLIDKYQNSGKPRRRR